MVLSEYLNKYVDCCGTQVPSKTSNIGTGEILAEIHSVNVDILTLKSTLEMDKLFEKLYPAMCCCYYSSNHSFPSLAYESIM